MATADLNINAHVTGTVCKFDLSHAIAIEHCHDVDDANELLQEGWVLVTVGIDANGFPLILLVQSDGGGFDD